jgi:predicted phosphodiesterase
MRFIVVADSHIRFTNDDVDTYPSNALMVDRNRRVVEMCNELGGEFVVHLGDIVHPLPVEESHEAAVQLAAEVYADLDMPIYFVPGNHDIGDKPDSMVAVPAVADENYNIFERYWGPAFRSFSERGCHFVVVDTPVLNSGLQRESSLRCWLEEDLQKARAAGLRIFIFTHYPPFIRAADEDEHYDNLAEPGRGWLLDLFVRYNVEALFSGHVHNFLYNQYRGTEMYVLPSTGFVRPDYSELAAIAPESEGGRDDPAKLGFFVVEVTADSHQIRPVRTHGSVTGGEPSSESLEALVDGAWRCPIGVTLRHGWMSAVDFPTSGLDEFRRKTVRNDSMLPSLWEARITDVRIPVGDLVGLDQIERIGHLTGRGMRFTVRSAGIPDLRTLARIRAAEKELERWEIVLWPHQYADAFGVLAEAAVGLPIAIAPVVRLGSGLVHHFVTSGFTAADEAGIRELADTDAARVVDEIVFRVVAGSDVAGTLAMATELASAYRRTAVVVADLPRAGEATAFDDEDALSDWVGRVARASAAMPAVPVFFDGFQDHDRSYYPRIGLVDRRSNPRQALYGLIAVSAGRKGSRA